MTVAFEGPDPFKTDLLLSIFVVGLVVISGAYILQDLTSDMRETTVQECDNRFGEGNWSWIEETNLSCMDHRTGKVFELHPDLLRQRSNPYPHFLDFVWSWIWSVPWFIQIPLFIFSLYLMVRMRIL